MPTGTRRTNKKPKWQEIAAAAQAHRDATIDLVQPAIPNLPVSGHKGMMAVPAQVLDSRELHITQMLPEELIDCLSAGKLSAKDATVAFLRRAAVAQKLTNCLTELLHQRALARAEYLDQFYAKHKRPIGPLHGLPVSVKEMLGMNGLRLHAGYCAGWDNIATDDAHVLKILWDAGAVFHARTTEPQSMMHHETDSVLYGVTVSPYDSRLSPGGSSGGEGALIATRGSCLGVGSDVAGSIRGPAAHNGVYGFKPTAFRIPTDGWSSISAGADTVYTSVGPLSTSLRGLSLFMEIVLAAKPWLREPALIPLPWAPSTITSSTPLKIAVMHHDNVVLPHPPVQRALETLQERLSAVPNISIVPWKAHLHDEAWAIHCSLCYADGGAEDRAVMASTGEPMRPLTKWMLDENPCVKKLTPEEHVYWLEEREEFRREYADRWNRTASRYSNPKGDNDDSSGDGRECVTASLDGAIDAILCPVDPGVAPRHNTAKYWGYTAIWNLLDYPAVVFPVDKVDMEVDVVAERTKFMSGADETVWNSVNDPETFHGLPVGLQLVTRRFEDEKALAILEYLQRTAGFPFVTSP